jgi:cell division protein FtsQ
MIVKKLGTPPDLSTPAQPESILARHRQLKRQRRVRFWQTLWRITGTIALAAGLSWGLSQPEWKIRSADQVQILGNTQLSSETIHALIPLTYPTSLIRIQPQAIATRLEQYAHIEQVQTARQLFPPRLILTLEERPPVAKIICPRCQLVYNNQETSPRSFAPSDLWLLDAKGVPLPLASYPDRQKHQSFPPLTVVGFFKTIAPSRSATAPLSPTAIALDPFKQRQWPMIYQAIQSSPVSIQEIDWRNPNNLILKTELGLVHLGMPSENLPEQLKTLDQMRHLGQSVDLKQVNYINLVDPEKPTLELKIKKVAK